MHEVYFDTVFTTLENAPSWPAEFAILSAYATTGEIWPEERNLAADARLERELRARCQTVQRITGASPDGAHAEPSWAVEISLDEALAIAARFEQDAIYYVREDVLFVIAVRVDSSMVVGSFRSRLSAQR
jgi:hypothetical protein